MIFDALVAGHLRRNPWGTLLTVAAIAFGVASMVATGLTSAFADRAIRVSILGTSQNADLQITALGWQLGTSTLRRVREVPGVFEARPVLEGAVILRKDNRKVGLTAHLQGIDSLQNFPGSSSLRRYDPGPFAPPGALEFALIERRGIILSNSAAARLKVGAGSTLEVIAAGVLRSVVVVTAVLPVKTSGLDPNGAFVDITMAQRIFNVGTSLDRIDVVADRNTLDAVKRRLEFVLPRTTRVVSTAGRIAMLEELVNDFGLTLAVLAFVALALGSVLVANAVGISVRQRRPEIAMLRSLGTTRGRIFRTFLAEGALLGALGGVIGTLLGDALARVASGFGDYASLGESGADLAADVLQLGRGITFGLLLSIAAAVAPAVKAACILPASALRIVPVRNSGRRTVRLAFVGVALILLCIATLHGSDAGRISVAYLCVLGALLGVGLCVPLVPMLIASTKVRFDEHLSVSGRLAIARVRANTARLSLVIVTLVISVCASIGAATATSSFHATITDIVESHLPGDLEVVAAAEGNVPLPYWLRDRVANLSGVAQVATVRRTQITIARSMMFVDAVDERTLAHRGTPLSGRDAVLPARIAQRLNLRKGDPFVIEVNGRRLPLIVRYLADSYRGAEEALTIDAESYAARTGDRAFDAISVVAQNGHSLERLRNAIIAAGSPVPLDVRASRESRSIEESLFNGSLSLASAVGYVAIAIAILGTAITMMTLVTEQRRELLLLRVLGISIKTMQHMLLYEALIVSSLSAIVGVVTGFGLGAMLVVVVNGYVSGYSLNLKLPLASAVATPIVVVIVAMLSALIPARIAGRRFVASALTSSL